MQLHLMSCYITTTYLLCRQGEYLSMCQLVSGVACSSAGTATVKPDKTDATKKGGKARKLNASARAAGVLDALRAFPDIFVVSPWPLRAQLS